MVANDRPVSPLVPTARESAPQTALFAIAKFEVSLVAGAGSATLIIALQANRDEYILDPGALDSWANASARLLELTPAQEPDEQVEFRAPFLFDIEGRAAMAFECAVTQAGTEYRLLVAGAAGDLGLARTTADTVRSVIEAASGAAACSVVGMGSPGGARPPSPTESNLG